MTVIYVNLAQSAGGSTDLAGFNNFFAEDMGAGLLSNDLLDENGVSTGITLAEGATPFTATGVSTGFADESPDARLPLDFFQSLWGSGGDGEKFVLGGFAPGQPYTLELAGQNANNRDTRFSATNSTPASIVYDVQSDPDPDPFIATQPVILTGTADASGFVSITAEIATSVSLYGNGFILTYEATPTLRKGGTATFTKPAGVGTITEVTLNGNVISLDSQTADVFTVTDDGSEIVTSGEYDLIVTGDTVETIVVEVTVYPPSFVIDQAEISPGMTITGQFVDFYALPTIMRVKDDVVTLGSDTGRITGFSATSTGYGKGTFTGTLPGLPTSGSEQMPKFGEVTVELSA